MSRKRLVAIHLLNDYSGSPLVFRQAIETIKEEYAVTLYTATPDGTGFLSDIEGAGYKPVFYRWSTHKLLTLLYYLLSQTALFFSLLKTLTNGDTVYINTLLPFGAAWAAKLKRCTVVYHLHEVSIRPKLLKNFLTATVDHTAHRVLFVSQYVANQFQFSRAQSTVVYNCLPDAFTTKTAGLLQPNLSGSFTVLMICSLKAYKGVYEFIALAKELPRIRFVLVLNASQKNVAVFKKEAALSHNCFLYPAQKDTTIFYKDAHVVMNLSRPQGWIETFGLTVLEAMHCGRPVIVPQVGGVCELVQHGVEGYCIDSSDKEGLIKAITQLSTDFKLYLKLAAAAREKAASFSSENFTSSVQEIFDCGKPYKPQPYTRYLRALTETE